MTRALLTLATACALALLARADSLPASARLVGSITTVRRMYAAPMTVPNAQALIIVDEVQP
jgi:hypothetical protein